jgi:hypothetical protein
MEAQVSAVERSFQLARSGRVRSIARTEGVLRKEGYINGQLDSLPALVKQLRTIMEAARPKLARPIGPSFRRQESLAA